MANTRFVLLPNAAEFPATAFPQLMQVNRRQVLAYDASTQEAAYWTAVAPQGFTGTVNVAISYIMASATSGDVEFEVALEAVTDADALDLDATTSFDTVNTVKVTVPGTAGYMDVATATMTNADSIAAGDYFRLSVSRDADDSTNDTATGDLYLLTVEIRDAV